MQQFQQDTEHQQQSDLPNLFTDQIIRFIQQKDTQQKRQESLSSVNSQQPQNQQHQEQSVFQQFAKKINHQIFEQNIIKQQKEKQNMKGHQYKKRKITKMSLPEKNLQNMRSKKRNKQANKAQITQDYDNVLTFQKALKEYFEQYFTKILQKMQSVTNSKLQQIAQRIANIEKGLPNLYPSTPPIPHKKGTYVKNREKLQYVEKIEKGKLSVREVANSLDVDQKVVRSWILNKQSLRQKQKVGKQRKYQKQLQNILF